jgi:hypothetical protein
MMQSLPLTPITLFRSIKKSKNLKSIEKNTQNKNH